jgi:uncharacterized protein (TIGR02145 family)
MKRKLLPILALLLMTVTCAVAQNTHTVTLKEGTEDAVNWKGKVGNDATVDFSALPLENVTEGATVTLQYNGTKMVKSVTAEKKEAEPAVTLATPLTMEALTAGTIVVNNPPQGMQYSLNGVDTIAMTTTTNITVSAGDKVAFFGNGTNITSYYGTTITGSGDGFTCKVYGNIMSLVNETGYETAITLASIKTFMHLFWKNTKLTDASQLLLPATQLANSCYYGMFSGCTGLTAAPALPATTLASSCYEDMFLSCTGLTAAPALPATTLANYCYRSMFQGCTGLTAAPTELPATTLAAECYRYMFASCTNLTAAPVLPATQLANSCYYMMFSACLHLNSVTCLATSGINQDYSTYNWLDGVAATGTFTAVSTANWPTNSANGIPSGWTRVDAVTLATPLTMEALTAGTIVVNNPPQGMQYSLNGVDTIAMTTNITVSAGDKVAFFGNGTNITEYDGTTISGSGDGFTCKVYGNIMSLVNETGYETATTLTGSYTFSNLFQNNTTLTDASGLLLPATTLSTGCYAYMFSGCTSLTAAPVLPATTLAIECYMYMFQGCTGLTAAPALPATTLADECYMYMFKGCTGLTAAPVLPATQLASFCYYKMFHGCSNLSSVTCLATSGINQDYSTTNWLYGVATTGTFTKDANANWEAGYSGIPSGWTQTSTPINLSSNADGTVWTLNPMPGFDVELEIEYYQPAGDFFTVTYMDGDVELNVDTFYNQQPISEYIPSKLGWKFTGWNPALPELMPDENLTTYAQWVCDSVQDVDGNKYPTLFVNNTCWMTENLRTTRYADGRDIANIYEYQSALYQNVPQHYGLLYNWYDALDVNRPSTRATSPVYIQGVCPDGYHIPTAAEVAFLLNTPAHALCSTTGWITPNSNTNSSEFTAYPAGLYNAAPARYEGLGTQTDWWMASGTQNHQSLQIQYYCSTPQIVNRNPDDAVSVRCVLND